MSAHFTGNGGAVFVGVDSDNASASLVHVTHDIALFVFRNMDHNGADRFEEYRVRKRKSVLECKVSGNLERHFGRVDVVVRTVDQSRLQIHDGESGKNAAAYRFLKPLLNGREEVSRYGTAENILFEHKRFGLCRFNSTQTSPYWP
jgi:hypothetical protein